MMNGNGLTDTGDMPGAPRVMNPATFVCLPVQNEELASLFLVFLLLSNNFKKSFKNELKSHHLSCHVGQECKFKSQNNFK